MTAEWKLSGTYFETCNCEPACPCIFLSPPTTPECTLLVGWHIDSGHFGDVALDGLNLALFVYSPGHMAEVPWQAALYFDDRAAQEQNAALTQIFTGQAGGHPGMLVSHVGEVLGIKSVPINYEAEGKQRRLRIAGVAEAEIEAATGQGDAEITITNHPLCIAPGYTGVLAKSTHVSYQDHGFDCELSEKTGLYSPFSYQGP